MDDFDSLVLYKEGEIAKITINRPKSLNALNFKVLEELSNLVLKIEDNLETKVVIIEGAEDKAFVAGADIKAMHQASKDELKSFIDLGQKVMSQIESSSKIFIAKVKGYALGGGFELALACDFIIASEKASFALPEVGLGLIPGFGGTQRLHRRVGIGFAKFMAISAERINADLAFSKGIIDSLIKEDNFNKEFDAFIKRITSKGFNAQKSVKELINSFDQSLLSSALKNEADKFIEISDKEEAKEGMSAFLENRKANF